MSEARESGDGLSRSEQEKLFHRLIFPVIRCLMRLGASREDAQELGSETMLIVFRKLDANPDFIYCHRAYAIVVARRLFYKRLKKQKDESTVHLTPEATSQIADDVPVPTVELEEVLATHTAELLRGLSSRDVEIVRMIDNGIDTATVAQLLCMTQENVRVALSRARSKIYENIRAIWRKYYGQ